MKCSHLSVFIESDAGLLWGCFAKSWQTGFLPIVSDSAHDVLHVRSLFLARTGIARMVANRRTSKGEQYLSACVVEAARASNDFLEANICARRHMHSSFTQYLRPFIE